MLGQPAVCGRVAGALAALTGQRSSHNVRSCLQLLLAPAAACCRRPGWCQPGSSSKAWASALPKAVWGRKSHHWCRVRRRRAGWQAARWACTLLLPGAPIRESPGASRDPKRPVSDALRIAPLATELACFPKAAAARPSAPRLPVADDRLGPRRNGQAQRQGPEHGHQGRPGPGAQGAAGGRRSIDRGVAPAPPRPSAAAADAAAIDLHRACVLAGLERPLRGRGPGALPQLPRPQASGLAARRAGALPPSESPGRIWVPGRGRLPPSRTLRPRGHRGGSGSKPAPLEHPAVPPGAAAGTGRGRSRAGPAHHRCRPQQQHAERP